MIRVLITGARGFVGPYLVQALRRSCDNNVDIIATAKTAGCHALLGPLMALDVTDRAALEAAIASANPTHVINLAGLAAPTTANADPEEVWRVHLHGTLDLARAILRRTPDCWLIHVGSALVYGESAKAGRPLDENALLAPLDEPISLSARWFGPRPGDLPILIGDAGRARKLLHWKPEYSLEDTLTALLNDCRERAAQ